MSFGQSLDTMLLFQPLQILLTFGEILLRFCHLFRLVIQDCNSSADARPHRAYRSPLILRTNKVPILKVESVQFVTSLFCVHDILIDYERGALAVIGYTLPYLPTPPFSIV